MISPDISRLPPPFEGVQARERRHEWLAAARAHTGSVQAFAASVDERSPWSVVLDSVFGNSPFLGKLLDDHPDVLADFAASGPDAVFEKICANVAAADYPDIAAAMPSLRIARARAALLIALADITECWTVDRVIEALSDFADRCVKSAVRLLLRTAHTNGLIKLENPDDPQQGSGYVVLAVGKLGGRELNYSSDIDLFVLYDEQRLVYTGPKTAQEFAIQITKDLVKILQERTSAGYVFRTDLRLRPDPGSTAIAVSRGAAQIYYESYGQNWERAALIKARQIAGDEISGAGFLHDLQPFIWRKSLDFYAIQDIHSIKRQIYAHKGGGTVTVPGHNIKVGRGGIREIEFFAQVQQLIWGGRMPKARVSQTLPALEVLTELNFVTPKVRDDLKKAYRALRKLEHRLQMVADQQTQTMPTSRSELTHIALFMGHTDVDAFMAEVESNLRLVETHYAGLFEDAPSLAVEGNLVFTGTEDDPDTLATLRRFGYQDPGMVTQMVRGWHHGRYRATRSNRARQLLTEVIPSLLASFGKTAQPDAALIRFDRCLAGLPAGVPILSVFYSNPELLDLVAEIMGDAPRLADHLTRAPTLLDYVLEPEFYKPIDGFKVFNEDLARVLEGAEAFELMLDLCRRWLNDQQFRVGVHALRGLIDPLEAGRHFTALAEAVICNLIPRVATEFARHYGEIPRGQLAVIAYGKLGSHEMTPTSDLDLVIVYDADLDATSDGAKSFPASAYYIRLSQRIVSAFTALTSEGKLYSIDMRLRPNGEKGPLACSFEAFAKYQLQDAWTWEHMALTRARVVYGDEQIRGKLEKVIADALTKPRDPAALVVAVGDMRARMRKDKGEQGPWSIKHRPGGLVDAEFIVQYLALATPEARPQDTDPRSIIASLSEHKALTDEDAETLVAGFSVWGRLQQLLRLTFETDIAPADIPLGLKQKLARAVGAADFDACERLMEDTARAISELFQRLIAGPAQQARPSFDEVPH
ncbi:MAG: bifunctional [glutamine synthetase] adenylyltransferase/[glutamine synthetase]-adenylyl-L-tyrosine phosphorylase [Rhodospirillaceae bacterium]